MQYQTIHLKTSLLSPCEGDGAYQKTNFDEMVEGAEKQYEEQGFSVHKTFLTAGDSLVCILILETPEETRNRARKMMQEVAGGLLIPKGAG